MLNKIILCQIYVVLFSTLFCIINGCSSGPYPFEGYLGTRTPYRIVGNTSFDQIQYKGCKPLKIWMIIRHGTRNPSEQNIGLMKNRLPQIRDLLLEKIKSPTDMIRGRDIDQFRKWKSKFQEDEEMNLAPEGEEEMIILAERMQSRFPEVFDKIYSNTSYNFKFTFSQRTKKSAIAFAKGLFGKRALKDIYFPEPVKRDPILRFYQNCDKWQKDIKKNDSAMGEVFAFDNSAPMRQTVNDINARLGLKGDDKLSVADVKLIYHTCGYETAWNKLSKSPWCSILTNDDFKVLEFAEDLRFYWRDGYGYELTYKQACPAFSDMIKFLEQSEKYPKSTVYFSHSGTILKLLAHIGLYKDNIPLKSSNYNALTNREWKTSQIDAFASNIAFVLFNCDKNEKKILTLHQEKIKRVPACPNEDLCSLKAFKQFYTDSLEPNCDFTKMCTLN